MTPQKKEELTRLARAYRNKGLRRPLEGGCATASGAYAWSKGGNREEAASVEQWHVLAFCYGQAATGRPLEEIEAEAKAQWDGWRDYFKTPRFNSTIEQTIRSIRATLNTPN